MSRRGPKFKQLASIKHFGDLKDGARQEKSTRAAEGAQESRAWWSIQNKHSVFLQKERKQEREREKRRFFWKKTCKKKGQTFEWRYFRARTRNTSSRFGNSSNAVPINHCN